MSIEPQKPHEPGPDDGSAGANDSVQANPYAKHAQAAADKAKAAAQDALGVARRLFTNPVAGIGTAHASLGQDRILGVAIVFALVAAIGLSLAGGLLTRTVMGLAMGVSSNLPGFGFTFNAFFQSLVGWLVLLLAAGGGVLLFSPVFGGRTNPASALLVSATAYLPLGITAILGIIVGSVLRNRLGMMVVALLALYGMCYLVLVLNAGLRHVAGVDERKAALATPTVLAFAALVAGVIGWLFS